MYYKEEFTSNNADIQTILDMVNALPDVLDTSDATAAAGDIASGKTAYVNGEKVTGTKTLAADTPANATAADIASGKTAWVNGAKVTGTLAGKQKVGTVTCTQGSNLRGQTTWVNVGSWGFTGLLQGDLLMSQSGTIIGFVNKDQVYLTGCDQNTSQNIKTKYDIYR